MAELQEQSALAGTFAQPSYLISDNIQFNALDGAGLDQVALSPSQTFVSTEMNSVFSAVASQNTGGLVEEMEQYLANTTEYNNSLNETPPTPPPPPPPPTGDSTGSAIDQVNSLEAQNDADTLDFTETNYSHLNGDGYYEPDAEKLEEWAKKIIVRANVMMALLIALTSQFEAKQIAEEIFSGIQREPDGKYSYKKIFARKFQSMQKIVQTAIAKVFEWINTQNMRIYNEKMAAIKKEGKGFWKGVKDFFKGGADSKARTQQALKESQKYLESTKRTLGALQRVLNSIATFLEETAGEGEGAIFNLGMAKFLKGFSAKLEEVNKQIDQKLNEVNEKLRQMEEKENKPWYKKMGGAIWHGVKSIFTLDFKGLLDSINEFLDGLKKSFDDLREWLGPVGYIMDPFGSLTGFDPASLTCSIAKGPVMLVQWAFGYLDDGTDPDYQAVDVKKLVDEYRGGLVGMQNAYRMYLALKLFQADVRNAVREKFTGLTGVSNDAELLMASAEATMGNGISMFDMAASQLMLKIKLHNQVTKLIKDLNQMRKAEPLRALAPVALVVSIVLAAIGTVLSFGTAGVPLWIGVATLAAGLAAGLSSAGAAAIEADIDGYNAVEPGGGQEAGRTSFGCGHVILDTFENLDRQTNINSGQAARDGGLMVKNKDGSYSFDTHAFASYEMRQNIINNSIRAIFNLIKNGRDMRRIVESEFTGSALVDSGEALLQNSVEHILSQKQIILSAVKFQLQEKITAKNIARESKLRAKKAVMGAVWSVAGAAAGGFLGGCLGGLPGIMIGAGIGSAMASSGYNFYQAGWGEGNARGADLNSSNADLERLFARQGDDSTEGRLDRAEAQAYLDLMNSGIVSAGNGYYGINLGLVTSAYSKIGAIYSAKEALAKMRAFSSELRSIVKQQMAGITLATVGDLSQSVNQANFGTAMRVMSNITSFLSAKVQLMNRAVDAEHAFKMSAWSFGINAALSVTGFSCMGAFSAGSQAFNLTAGLAPSLMSLNNSINSLASHIIAANGDLGAYNNYNAKTTVEKTGRRTQNNPEDVDQKLANAEYDILSEMGQGLIESLDGANVGVSAAAAKISTRMRNLYNIKEALTIARSLMADSRLAAGAKINRQDFGRENVDQNKSIMLAMVDAMKQALETIITRQNQVSEAKKGIILSAIATGISLLSIACAVKASEYSSKVINNKTVAPSSSAKPGETAPVATAKPAVEVKTPSAAQAAPSAKTPLTGAEKQPKYLDNPEGAKAAKWYAARDWLSLTGIALDCVADNWFDSAHNDVKAKEPKKTENVDSKRSAVSADNGGGGYFNSSNNMDADIAESEYQMEGLQNNSAAMSYAAARYDKLFHQTIVGGMKDTCSALNNYGPKNPLAYARSNNSTDTVPAPKISPASINSLPPARRLECLLGLNGNDPLKAAKYAQANKIALDQPSVEVMVKMEKDPVKQAQIAALLSPPPQAPQPAEPGKTNREQPHQTTSRSRALLEQANRIEARIESTRKGAANDVRGTKEKIAGVKGEIEEIEGKVDVKNKEINDLKASAVQADPATLERIEARIKEIQGELPPLRGQLQSKKIEVAKLKGEIKERLAARKVEAGKFRADHIKVNQEIREGAKQSGEEIEQIKRRAVAEKRDLTTEELAAIGGLEEEIKTAQKIIEMNGNAEKVYEASDPEMDEMNGRLDELNDEIKKFEGRINGLQEELKGLQKVITSEKEKQRAAAAKGPRSKNDTVSGQRTTLAFVSEFLGFGKETRKKTTENIDREIKDQKPGERAAAGRQAIAAAGFSGLGKEKRNSSPRDLYDQVVEQEETLSRMVGVGSREV